MSFDIYKVGVESIKKQFSEVVKDAQRIMRANAPYPTGRPKGKGSESTGRLAMRIHTEQLSETKAFVGTRDSQIPYAHFADDGRGEIKKKKAMVWYDKRGRKHVAYTVSAMEGWHYVEKTKSELIAKYGGK